MNEDFKQLTKELYKKNFELVRSNQELVLMQKLYEFMAEALTIKDLARKFIELLVAEMGFESGVVALKDNKALNLRIVAHTKTKFDREVMRVAKKNYPYMKFNCQAGQESDLVEAVHKFEMRVGTSIDMVFRPYLDTRTAEMVSQKTKVRRSITFYIKSGKVRHGAFCVFLKENYQFDKWEERVLQQLATVFGIAIDRINLIQDLKTANVNLKDLNQMKNDFVNIATHELKNPVAAMRGFLGMLNEGLYGEVPKNVLEPITMIHECNEQVVELINDLLNIARSDSKKTVFNKDEVSIVELVAQEMKTLLPQALKKKLKFSHLATAIPKVVADKIKLKEVIYNLLSNAVKYTNNGIIIVEYEVKEKSLKLAVIDQGIGIAEDEIDKLCSRFYRAKSGIESGAPGTGLGLFIVKDYIEKMGGSLTIKSKLGQGSRFEISLKTV